MLSAILFHVVKWSFSYDKNSSLILFFSASTFCSVSFFFSFSVFSTFFSFSYS